jgi:hypothetical protein
MLLVTWGIYSAFGKSTERRFGCQCIVIDHARLMG